MICLSPVPRGQAHSHKSPSASLIQIGETKALGLYDDRQHDGFVLGSLVGFRPAGLRTGLRIDNLKVQGAALSLPFSC